jgi:hypothetical protein
MKLVFIFLMGLLKDKDSDVRCTTVFALRSLGPVAREALPLLINCLKDPDSGVRFLAILSLGEIHQEPERTIPILIEYLDAKEQSLRSGALWSLRQFGAEAKPAFTNVLKLINDGDRRQSPQSGCEATAVNRRVHAVSFLPRKRPGQSPLWRGSPKVLPRPQAIPFKPVIVP